MSANAISSRSAARVSFAVQPQGKSGQTNKRNGSNKSILKRPLPAALPLSPTSHSASEAAFPFRGINALLSPSNNGQFVADGLTSPHVHFPPTPSMTTTSFAAYSPGTYDRAPIEVQPNDLAIPGRGERVYTNRQRNIPSNIPADVQADKPTRASKVFRSKPASAMRFEPMALNSPIAFQEQSPGSQVYPVSPYPYAAFAASPLSASFFPVTNKAALPFSPLNNREFVPRNKENSRCSPCSPTPSRVARKRGRRPAALNVPAVVMNPFRVPTPVVNIDVSLSPVVESAPDSGVVSEDESHDHRLSSAFWNSVSLIDLNTDMESDVADQVEGCAYPVSALELQDTLEAEMTNVSSTTTSAMKKNLDLTLNLDSPIDADMESPAPVLFGRSDGTLWSPGLPRRQEDEEVPTSAVSNASTEMTMYTASAGYSAAAAVFSPGIHSPSVHSFSAHRASFGQRMGAISRVGFNAPGFNMSRRNTLDLALSPNDGLNSPAPFKGNPISSPLASTFDASFVSVTSPGAAMTSFSALQSPSAFGGMAQHHGLGFTSPSPMGAAFPSFGAAAEKIETSAFDASASLQFPAKALMGDGPVEGRSRVFHTV